MLPFSSVLCFGISLQNSCLLLLLLGKQISRKDSSLSLCPFTGYTDDYINFGRFDSEEEAVAIANATDVGLAGRCHSDSVIIFLRLVLECSL